MKQRGIITMKCLHRKKLELYDPTKHKGWEYTGDVHGIFNSKKYSGWILKHFLMAKGIGDKENE